MIDDLTQRLNRPRFPRSAGYDPRWMIENWMGPSALWLLEWLCSGLDLAPGARVLDLGCGRAVTSIFLAKEFGVQVVAADLWIPPTENWRRIDAAGQAKLVTPLLAEAHDLPFAEGYFDAIVSVDAYHYFGTDALYLANLSRFLAPGGQIGIVVPGLTAEFDDGLPEHLEPFWEPDFWTFHSPAWWQQLWNRSGVVERRTRRFPGRRVARLAGLERSRPGYDPQRLRPQARSPGGEHAARRHRPQPRLHPGHRQAHLTSRPNPGPVRLTLR